MPLVFIAIVLREAAPGGVRETAVPCVAPSVANAWARLTGNRQRSLPFFPGTRMTQDRASPWRRGRDIPLASPCANG